MTEQLLQLSDCDLREIAAALRANRLATPVTAVGLQRLLASRVAGTVAGELQQMIEQGFTSHQLSVVLELIAKDRGQRPELEEVLDLVTTGPEVAGPSAVHVTAEKVNLARSLASTSVTAAPEMVLRPDPPYARA